MAKPANDKVLQILSNVSRGDFLEVYWLDAATVKNAYIEKLPLPDDYVQTRRRTMGLYLCVQKEPTWHVPILALLMDQTDHPAHGRRANPEAQDQRLQ